jgi:alpha-ketoglutarate-dependent taurine dioxygenase
MTVMQKDRYTARDLAPCIATEIRTDVETLLNGAIAQDIRGLLEERGVIVFPAINLTDEQQIIFTKTIGTHAPETEKGVFKVTLDAAENEVADYLRSGFFWHLDGTMDKLPIRASILSARRLSPIGGQTEWANTYAAYEALSETDKAALANLRARHTLEALHSSIYPEPSYAQLLEWREHPSRTLPIVWNHRSGRKSLIVGNSAGFIEGMDRDESRLLLARLRDHATQPQFVYRHEWTIGDMVMWDNCGTIHRAIRYPADSGRLMHRTKIKGEEAFA